MYIRKNWYLTPFILQVILLMVVNSCYAESNNKYEKYKLLMSNNDKICRYMGKMFDDDITHYGEVKYDNHSEFNTIKWRVGSYSYVLPYNKMKESKGLLFSIFDINNDGIDETVLKEGIYLRGFQGDQIIVLSNKKYNLLESPEIKRDIYNKFPGIKTISKWPYKLELESSYENYKNDEYYYGNNILKLLSIHPFIINGITYLSMEEIRRIKNRPLWHVIVKYTDDSF